MNNVHRQRGQRGYLLLADISGFDAYLVDVELEHAQGVLEELLELIVSAMVPPMTIANVKPDAVLTYKPESELTRGETLLELTEATYTAFRDRLKSIARNNLCGCRACAAVPTLDLKFLVHFGEYTVQPTNDGHVVLGGLDAKLIRDRLIKDQISSGSRSYALFTAASLEKMGVLPEGMVANSGEYPHMGEIRTGLLDLADQYHYFNEERFAFVIAELADVSVTHDFQAPPPVVWDWINDPTKRTRWLRWTKWQPGLRPLGRTGVGAVNHCTHGVGSLIETILDWRPYRYFTVEMDQASLWSNMLATYELEPLPDGSSTRLFFRAVLQKAPALWLSRRVLKVGVPRKLKQDFQRMEALMVTERESFDLATPGPSPVAEVTRP
jgi:hypothetical protein